MKTLEDGRVLLAAYDDIDAFFKKHNIVGRVISDIIPSEHDYMIRNIDEIEGFEYQYANSVIETDGFVCLVFEDGDTLEVYFSGDGPLVLGFNTAKLDEYPKYDGSCYTLHTLFKYCIGYRIIGLFFEKTDKKMMFPEYCGIDMSEEDEGVEEIYFMLEGGTSLLATSTIDYFRFEHLIRGKRSYTEVKFSELLSELSEAAYNEYFADWLEEQKKKIEEIDSLVRFSEIPVTMDAEEREEYGRFGFKNAAGEVVIEPQFLCAHDFHHGLCAVAVKGPRYTGRNGKKFEQELWGYIDETGYMVIQFLEAEHACDFNKYGVAVVQADWNEYYLIDTKGNEIPHSRFAYIDPYSDYNERFLEISYGDPGLDTNVGLYDTKTRSMFVEPKTCSIIAFDDDYIAICESRINGIMGASDYHEHVIDSNKKEKYPALLDKDITGMDRPDENGYITVYKRTFFRDDSIRSGYYPLFGHKYGCNQKYGVLDTEGNVIIPIEYDSIRETDGVFVCTKDGVTETIKPKR